jgi:hypothetical protein
VTRAALLFSAFFLLAWPASADDDCPNDWYSSKKGDCWLTTPAFSGKPEKYYVHQHGWLIREDCVFHYGGNSLLDFMTTAWNKMNPAIGPSKGGCMSVFNPGKGQGWIDDIWTRRIILTCDQAGSSGDTCAATRKVRMGQGGGEYREIALMNVGSCDQPGGTGVPGIIFHETLHALDVTARSDHNSPENMSQVQFVQDQVYGAEMVCFYGMDAKTRKDVNIVQCTDLADGDPNNKCNGFNAEFSDYLRAGIYKHEGP